MAGLEECTSLEELWMGKNKITQIAGIGTLTRLRRLDVQSNRLTAIGGLEGLTDLRELYLSHNVIESAVGLESQVRLPHNSFYRKPLVLSFSPSRNCLSLNLLYFDSLH